MDAKLVGKRIKAARKERGLTQAQLSNTVGLTQKYLSNVECGNKTPRLDTFVRIVNALQCDADMLLCDVLENSEEKNSAISAKLARVPAGKRRLLIRIIDFAIDTLIDDNPKKNREE